MQKRLFFGVILILCIFVLGNQVFAQQRKICLGIDPDDTGPKPKGGDIDCALTQTCGNDPTTGNATCVTPTTPPVAASSQTTLKDSCKLVGDIKWPGKYCSGNAPDYTIKSCLDANGKVQGNCELEKDDTVGDCSSGMNFKTPDWGAVCLINTVNNVTNWLFYLMSAVAVLLFIVGGVFYMTAGGDPDKAKKGKTIIIYAIIGLAIALVAKMIPSLVTTVIAK